MPLPFIFLTSSSVVLRRRLGRTSLLLSSSLICLKKLSSACTQACYTSNRFWGSWSLPWTQQPVHSLHMWVLKFISLSPTSYLSVYWQYRHYIHFQRQQCYYLVLFVPVTLLLNWRIYYYICHLLRVTEARSYQQEWAEWPAQRSGELVQCVFIFYLLSLLISLLWFLDHKYALIQNAMTKSQSTISPAWPSNSHAHRGTQVTLFHCSYKKYGNNNSGQ